MTITPAKDVRRKASAEEVLPPDEGIKFFDGEGEEIEVDEVKAFDIDDEDIDMTVETIKKTGDEGIVQEIMQNLFEKVVKTEQKNPLLGCINIEVDVDIKKDILFLDKNEETAALFTPFVIKLKEICNTGRSILRERIKTNHEVKRIVKSENNNESVVANGDADLDL